MIREMNEIAPGQLAILDLGIDPATEFGEFGLTILPALARMQWRRYQARVGVAADSGRHRGCGW